MIDNEGFKISDQAKPHFVISYDKNGNIQSLDRKGHIVPKPFQANSGDFGLMDRLAYQYDSGNKLLSVTDTGTTTTGFKDGNTSGDDYSYDENGNMLTDGNKGITNIKYNHLNLPTEVQFNTGGLINYVYDASGGKLEKTASNGTYTEYAGNYVYEGGKLQFFNHTEGYVSADDNSFKYVYRFTDHLGNVRLSYADSDGNGSIDPTTEIIEESNYYPLGMKHKGYNDVISPNGNSTAQKWKFQGVELEEALGLNLYEMEFRNYDPTIGRFMSIDPLAEEREWLTPYNFVQNNPILRVDPTGLLDTYGLDENGNVRWIDDKKYYDDDGFEVDKLVADKTGNSIMVEDGTLDCKTNCTNKNGDTLTVISTNNEEQAKDLFEFGAQNTNVEFGLHAYSDSSGENTFSVFSNESNEYSSLDDSIKEGINGYTPIYNVHSHPNDDNDSWDEYPSGYGPASIVQGDRGNRGRLEKKFGAQKTYMYHTGNKSLTEYGKNKNDFIRKNGVSLKSVNLRIGFGIKN